MLHSEATGPFVSSGDTDQKHTFPLTILVRDGELVLTFSDENAAWLVYLTWVLYFVARSHDPDALSGPV